VCNHRCLGGTARAPPVRSVTTRRTQEPAHARGYALGRTAAQVDTVRNSATSACSGRGPYIDRSCTRDSPLVSFSVMPKPSAVAARVQYENVDWFKMSQVSLRDGVLAPHRLSGGPAVDPGLSPCGKDRLDQGPGGRRRGQSGTQVGGSCPRTTMPGLQGIEGWRIRRFQSWSTPDGISVVPRH
jgi:hypothetical protein